MEANEISMLMDTKLDVHDKFKLKQWTQCQVQIEAVKCLPCFLRISFTCKTLEDNAQKVENKSDPQRFSVTINVPGVTISLATSRTRQHSFGVFWTQSRKKCFIYFALETETKCRRLMKWLKKSMKNLELYRQIVLEQRRNSRGPAQMHAIRRNEQIYKQEFANLQATTMDSICSHASGIYEEISDRNIAIIRGEKSRNSVASGIYEEMKSPTNTIPTKKPIEEEAPPLPPLPPQRKRINTYETESTVGFLVKLPRSNTNPESEAIKKKKYKNMFDNLFGGARSKRAESVSETQASSIDDVINCQTPKAQVQVTHTLNKRKKELQAQASEKRNSFSSPDLSKINLLQFDEDEEKSADVLNNSFSISQDLTLSCNNLTEEINVHKGQVPRIRTESIASMNVSAQIPLNFNFSACNTSKMNLMGANGANQTKDPNKLQIPIDDLTGYCLMAPIMLPKDNTAVTVEKSTSKKEDSAIYENMHSLSNCSSADDRCISPSLLTGSRHFSHHIYENLLTFKATQELGTIPVLNTRELNRTSTPTEVIAANSKENSLSVVEEENFYQTPRKSIISIDEKIPSYYPNVNEHKVIRRSRSPLRERMLLASEIKPQIPVKQRNKLPKQENVMCSNGTVEANVQTGKIMHVNKKNTAQKVSENVYAVSRKNKNIVNKTGMGKVELEEKVNIDLLQLSVLPKIDFKFDDIQSLVTNYDKCAKTAAQVVGEENLLRSPCAKGLARATRAASTNTPNEMQVKTNKEMLQQTPSNEGYGAQLLHMSGIKKYASLPRLKKLDFSPLKMKITNALQRQFTPPREIQK